MPTSCWMRFSSSCISLRSFRSSAPSGSSSSSTRGRLTSARASATRCCWPPESWRGLRLLEPAEADELERLVARAAAARSPRTFCRRRPKATFSKIVRCGKSAYDWKTVLTSRLYGGSEPTSRAAELDPARRSAPRSRRSSAASSSCRSRRGRAARRSCRARSRARGRRRRRRRRSASSGRRAGCRLRDLLPCLGEHLAERAGDLVELLLRRDQGRRDLDDRIAAVVRPADEALLEERGERKPRRSVSHSSCEKRLARLLVLHELERVEEARPAEVADDRKVEQLRERRTERVAVVA